MTTAHTRDELADLTEDERRHYTQARAVRGDEPRARTERSRLSRAEIDAMRADSADHPGHVDRPKTRADCLRVVRPCPWVSCKWNLAIDVKPNGNVTLNFPGREVSEMDPRCSCALDVADRGGARLEDVALSLNVTHERLRQIEDRALAKLARGGRGPWE